MDGRGDGEAGGGPGETDVGNRSGKKSIKSAEIF